MPAFARENNLIVVPQPNPSLVAPLQPPSESIGEQHNQPPANQKDDAHSDRGGAKEAPIVEMRDTPKADQQTPEEAADEKRKASTDRWTITLTAALVSATILQFLALLYQGYWLRKSVKVSETSLTDLEAPFVYIEITDPGIIYNSAWQTSFGDLRFRFVNYGRTPAHVTQFTVTVDIVPIGSKNQPPIPKIQPTVLPWGIVSGPNGGSTPEYAHALLPHRLSKGHIDFATERVFFLGWYTYTDIFKVRYNSGFCFLFNHLSNTFIRAGGDDRNYLKKCQG